MSTPVTPVVEHLPPSTPDNLRYARHPALEAVLPFIIGGTSGIVATICIQPIDMVKVRLQLVGEGVKTGPKPSPLAVARNIVAEGRVLDLYSGLSAALMRQVVYGTARLGFFFSFENALKTRAKKQARDVTFLERAGAALSAGGLGAMLGNPAEVVLIRMQSDGLKPIEQRKHYKSVFDALFRTARSEGILGLWAGAYPTVIRAMSTNFGQLAFFSETKHQLAKFESISEQTRTITASAVAGFFAAFFSLPFDFLKTRLQNQTRRADGTLPYKGMSDCAIKVVRNEGWLRFYRGFGTYFLRMAPHSVISLIVADNLVRLLKR